MDLATTAARWRSALLRALFGTLLAAGAAAAVAQADPPGRVGRIADLNGAVSWWDNETARWSDAERNRPLTSGDRISTAASGRAELRVGSTTLRLSNSSELEVLRLDDDRMVFQLHAGSLSLRLRSRDVAGEAEVVTAEARLLPQRAGHYRIDRVDDVTQAGAWRGELRIGDERGPLIGTGQRAELRRDGRAGGGEVLRQSWIALPADGFAAWVLAEDSRDAAVDERSASARYVSPEMTGAEDLDRYGRWDQHPEYGAVWFPQQVAADWAPYRHGRWTWVAPWGWTWVDAAPWGFAPFHYGRWVTWRDRWCWVPGTYVARPVYAPALVGWVGGSHGGVSVRIGGPPRAGWVPLAPRDVYRPPYRTRPVENERPGQGWPPRVQPAPLPVQPGPRRPEPEPERHGRPDRGERPDRTDRPERPDRPDRPDRGDRPDRPDRADRPAPMPTPMPAPMPVRPAAPVPAPAPAPVAAPPAPPARPAPVATPPAPAPAVAPPAPRPPAAERPRERERERDRDDDRKRRPESSPASRERENQR